jgi:hypothetical protein
MKMNFHTRTWAASGLMMLAVACCLTACDDDDPFKFQPAAPVVTAVGEPTSSSLTFSWSPVADAYEYQYLLTDENGVLATGGLTSDTLVTLTDLESATPYTLSVVAYAQDVMHSVVSEAGTATAVTADPPVDDRIWEARGTYTSVDLGTSWPATLVAYPDGSYKIEAWMGVEGYDFTFTVQSNGELACDYPLDTYAYYCVPTGLSTYPTAYAYTAYQCSAFSGTAESGSLWFYNYLFAGGYDTFTWGGE